MAKILRKEHREFVIQKILKYQYRDKPESEVIFDWEDDEPVLTRENRESFLWCQTHPEQIVCKGIQEVNSSYVVPTIAICECGKKIYLENEYHGFSQCRHCGRWHNEFGQLMYSPEMWELESC